MSSSKSAPELPDKADKLPDEEIITLDDNIDVISDDLTEQLQDSAEEAVEPVETEVGDTKKSKIDDPLADDPVIDKAVDEIVAEEGDTVLAAEDAALQKEKEPQKPARLDSPIAAFIKKIWHNPKARWGIGLGIVLLTAVLATVPTTRYFILNTAQVRASLEVTVIDSTTLQPLKNVTVKAANAEAKTDSNGFAKLEKVRLGKTNLSIEKRAFSPLTKPVTIGWGSNKQGEHKAIAVGTQYTFYVRDFLSGKPIERAEAASGEGNAIADADGKLVLTLDTADQEDDAQLNVQITADSYRDEELNITVNNREAQDVQLVPSRKHVFVTKRSGTYDVYSVDADGKNEKRVVSGMGTERDDVALVPHPTKNQFVYVATRENTRNASGYLLSTVYIVDMDSDDIMKIDQSEQVQIIGWSDDGHLIYAKIAAGASGTDPKRHRLVSFNAEDHSDTKELASSNSFNDVMMAQNKVYFAPSAIFNEAELGVYSINVDGTDKKRILDKEAYALLRTDYDKVSINVTNEWYGYTIGSPLATSSTAPLRQEGRVYTESPDDVSSLWVDSRDGKGVLLNYNRAKKEETTLVERGGLRLPVYWLDNKYVVYRVADGRESADYIVNIEGGEPRKIADVTDSAGISRWFYF